MNNNEWGDLSVSFLDEQEKDKKKNEESIERRVIEDAYTRRFIRNEEQTFLSVRNLTDLCGLPAKNEQIRIITEKAFNAYTLVQHLLQGQKIDELYIAIYRINEPTADALVRKIESGEIKKANFVLSNFFNQTKKPERWAMRLYDFAQTNDRCRVVFIHNHCKITLAKCGQKHIVFEGSGNLSDNARIEQYILEDNNTAYDFHRSWMDKILDNGK